MSTFRKLFYRQNKGTILPRQLFPGDVIEQYGVAAPRMFIVNSGGVAFDVANVITGTPVNAVAATGTLTFTGVVADAQTVTIGTRVYEFDTNAAVTEGHIAVDVSGGVTAAAAVTALVAAITGDTDAVVTAVDGAGDTVVVTAKIAGVSGNAIATTKVATNATWAQVHLTGGVNGTVGQDGALMKDTSYLYIATAENTVADANWASIDLASLGNDTSAAIGVLASLTTTAKNNLVAAINEVDSHADAATAALPNYLLAVTAGQKMIRNTQNVTGSLVVDLSATFASIDEVVAVLGVKPSMNANAVNVVIPTQTGADAGKFTIEVTKPTAVDNCTPIDSTTATAVHYIGFGTPK